MTSLEAALAARERQLEEGWQALHSEVALMTQDAAGVLPSSPVSPSLLVRRVQNLREQTVVAPAQGASG